MITVRRTAGDRRLPTRQPCLRRKCVVAMSRQEHLLDGKRVAVVGGGPAGMMAAAHVASLGADVDIYERYSENKKVPESSRSFRAGWLILLGSGVSKAFDSAGISPDLGEEHRVLGVRFIFSDRDPKFLGSFGNQDIESLRQVGFASRTVIADHIRSELARVYPSKVTVHEGFSCTGGDPVAGRLEFEGAAGEEVAVQADLVIGADGVNSMVRKLVQETDPSLTVDTERCCTKTLPVFVSQQGGLAAWDKLETPDGRPPRAVLPEGAAPTAGSSMHAFYCAPSAKDKTVAFVVSSGNGGAHTAVALTFVKEWWDEPKSEEEVLEDLKAAYPHVPLVWLQESAAEGAKVIAGENRRDLRQHTFLEPSKLGSGRAVLVGDAAHAMSPHLGMGCNSALTDGAKLGAALRAVGGDLDTVAAEFTAVRLPEVLALVRMTKLQYINVTAKIHKSFSRILLALPFGIAYQSAPHLPGWLGPRPSPLALQLGESPQRVERSLNGWGSAVLCCGTAMALALVVGILKAAALVAA
eukprot:jgi/Ulvmu1/5799/UM025_0054.1